MLKTLKKIGRGIVLGVGLFIAGHTYSQNININGTVTGLPNYNHIIGEEVVAVKVATGTRVDSAYTDINGHYNMNFIWNQMQEQNLSKQNLLYPNPGQGKTNIEFYAPIKDDYTLIITETNGKQLINAQIAAEKGNNKIVLNDGNEGIYFITLTNGEQTHKYKYVQTTTTGAKINYEFIRNASSNLKLTLDDIIMIGDEVRLEFTRTPTQYENYAYGDTTFIVASTQTINKQVQQTPYLFTTTLKPFLETGEPVTNISPNFTATFEFPTPTGAKTYSVTTGQINIQENLFPIDNLGSVWVSHDTSNYNGNGVQNWTLIRQPNQRTNRPNVAQNETTAGPLIPDYKTLTSLDSLDGKTLHFYTIRKKAETQSGQYEWMNSEFSKNLIESSGNGGGASTFIDLAPYGVADSADFVRFGFNMSNNVPNTQTQQTRLDNLFQIALDTRYLSNGDTLLPPHRVYTITSTADPRWQEVITRGFENCIYTTYYNGTPENSRFWSTTYTYNGKLRIKNTAARYATANGDGTIFEEQFSAVTGEEEGSGGLAPFVWNATTNQPSQYAKSISTVPVLLTLGTGQ